MTVAESLRLNDRPVRLLHHDIRAAQAYYKSQKRPGLFGHCKGVLDTSEEILMVERGTITAAAKGVEVPRGRMNSLLAQIILYHTIDANKAQFASSKDLPRDYVEDANLRDELGAFNRFVYLDRKPGASKDEYADLLSAPSLALLARIVDLSVTHAKLDANLVGFVARAEHPIFRTFDSSDQAKRVMNLDAVAAGEVYAPIAEALGYHPLAGSLFRHNIEETIPAIAELVRNQMINDDRIQGVLDQTISGVDRFKFGIEGALRALGYTAEVSPNRIKDLGKLMNKVRRHIVAEHRAYGETEVTRFGHTKTSFDDYLADRVKVLKLTDTFTDLVAFRVVLNGYHGKTEAEMNPEEVLLMKRTVADLIEGQLRMAGGVPDDQAVGKNSLFTYVRTEINKPNGYRAIHFDVTPNFLIDPNQAGFEIQVKTGQDHDIAEHGGPAHYLYIGGNAALTQQAKDNWSGLVDGMRSKVPRSSIPPGGRRNGRNGDGRVNKHI